MSAAKPGDGRSGDVPIRWTENDHPTGAGEAHWRSVMSDGREIRGLAFGCPCGCGESWVSVVKGPPTGKGHGPWGWDGNEASPSLQPSIRNTGCTWHGYLEAGVFKPQPESEG